jgi:plastocyanin
MRKLFELTTLPVIMISWLIVSGSPVLFLWYIPLTVDAQNIDDEGGGDGGRSTDEDRDSNSNDDGTEVIIPKNAAWSETIPERFSPVNTTVSIGSEVIWINEDNLEHTITSGNLTHLGFDGIHDGKFYSGVLGSGDSFSHIFEEAGIYAYFCSPHPWMNGYVIVEGGSLRDNEVDDGGGIDFSSNANREEDSNGNNGANDENNDNEDGDDNEDGGDDDSDSEDEDKDEDE